MPTPNLYLATQKLFKPHRWFERKGEKACDEVQHWDSPVPGTYHYKSGRGWYLTETDDETQQPERPIPVKYSRVLRRELLQPDYDARKVLGTYRDSKGRTKQGGFFRVDHKVAHALYLDSNGDFIPGPYKMWCQDKGTGMFRDMLKGDDPGWRSRHSSVTSSAAPSRSNSCVSPRASGDLERSPAIAAMLSGAIPATSSAPASRAPSRTTSFNDFKLPSPTSVGSSSAPSTRPNSLRHLNTNLSLMTVETAPTSPESNMDVSRSNSNICNGSS